jgi:hypothetical protein
LKKGEVVSIAQRQRNFKRQFLAFLSMILRWPIFIFFAVFRTFKINTLFTIYPGNAQDIEGYTLPVIRKAQTRYISGKPFIAGVITSGNGYGRGLVLGLPNTIEELKSNKKLVGKIIRRLEFARKVTGAKAIAIAGQGPRYFKTHYPHYGEPFVYGLRGRVFSVVETVERICEKHRLPQDSTTIALLGIGEIGEAIIQNLVDLGYNATGIRIHHREDGQVIIDNNDFDRLKTADLVVVQTPRGDDVIPYYGKLKKSAILVDDAHPRISVLPNENKFYKVAVGRPGVTFKPPLPGYKSYWIPGCVQESMVVAETGHADFSQDEFNRKSRELGFVALLVDEQG